eukprot:TRINITY_DN16570_c0_g1_i1.p1 TRINITY_DN16570_c0_g1~~TRINITY_DN16570_c0_g1_i1.p1  ORF type:complete len:387 (+),score=73.59 TRINITY_DN16570_c0_g1_i1:92-1252(+)
MSPQHQNATSKSRLRSLPKSFTTGLLLRFALIAFAFLTPCGILMLGLGRTVPHLFHSLSKPRDLPGLAVSWARADRAQGVRAMAAALPVDKPRSVLRSLLSKPQAEGDGATVRRSIGRPEMRSLDPFLLLDEANVQAPAGFPDHPHRGFETVSYMLSGTFMHEDFEGHEGTLEPGDLQWMTAGRGIMHSELPAGDGPCHGLQLWVNLAAKDKMVPAAYQELKSKDVPKVEKDGVHVAVIAGQALGVTSPVYTRTPTMFLDFTLQPGAALHEQHIPEGWNAFIYTLLGEGAVIGAEERAPTPPHTTCELGKGNSISVWNKGSDVVRFVLIGGQPLNEPVAQYGPFVMNTQEEVMQAVRDFQRGRNGFEKAANWESKGARARNQRLRR